MKKTYVHHSAILYIISNFEKVYVVILIAIKIMTLIVLNQDILFPLHLPTVKYAQQVAILKSLVKAVLVIPVNIAVVYAKNIHLSVILNVVTMIQV